ncbi:MAG: hypothetical protein IJ877_00150 [Candidatus Gastranaerophilales bacterium]|nr:hypothetical protein [Candidatus Gastranaerophilales bacterium]
MTFNPLKEKGLALEKQLRNWHQIVAKPYKKQLVDCYSRTRQILMNGIEVESWGFKHQFNRFMNLDSEDKANISRLGRIENQQQMTCNWLSPANQTVLETTLGYEQVAVDLTAWLSQNEPDKYVKETFDFGLLEDFDHLYRYSQFAYMEEGLEPNDIVQGKTDIILGRPTQHHHNCNGLRLRKHYDKNTASPQTKINILTVLSAEQQTHNFYSEHGFMYGDHILRETYAEIKDVEEEHVTMYESLIDPNETMFEKLLLHEFCEVCNYYTCLEDETDENLKKHWEIFLDIELGHLQTVCEIFKKYEKKDPEEVIGSEIIIPCRFKSQKGYVQKILEKEINKRLAPNGEFYNSFDEIPSDWASYKVQQKVGEISAPSENCINLIEIYCDRDIVRASDELKNKETSLLEKGLQKTAAANNTVYPDKLQEMIQKHKKRKNQKETLI